MSIAPPELLQRASREAIDALQKEELAAGLDIRRIHDELFRSYQEELTRTFLKYFVFRAPGGPEPPVQVWDPLKMQGTEALDDSLTGFDDLIDALDETGDDLTEDRLIGAYDDGYDRELWLLALGGLDTQPYLNQKPPRDHRRQLLLAAGLFGVSWEQRRTHWADSAKQRGKQWIRASVIGARSIDETRQGLDGVAHTYTGRVVGLLGNEMARAFRRGQDVGLHEVRRDYPDIEELWLTRQDALVCPVCAALHMTVTPLQPVDDTHPGCRCIKVPLTVNWRETDISFDDFLDDE